MSSEVTQFATVPPFWTTRKVVTTCLAVYAILAWAVFWPTTPWNSSTLPAGPYGAGFGDPTQMTWYLDWVAYAVRHGLNMFGTNYLNYPNGADLGNNTLAPFLGVLAMPVTLTLGPVAAFNLLLRLAFASSAGSMFLVLRNWARWPAAFLGGLFYGFGPYLMLQGGVHLNLAFVPVPPIIVWCLHDLLVAKKWRPVRMGLLLGALCGVQALIEPELLVLLGIVVALGLVGLAISVRHNLGSHFDRLATALPPATGVFLVLVAPLVWAITRGSGRLVGPIQAAYDLQPLHADLLGAVTPTSHQFFTTAPLNAISGSFLGGNPTENGTYLGIGAVILLIVFAVTMRRVLIVRVSAALAAVAFVLSLGSTLTVAGQPTGITLPETLLTRVRLFDNIVSVRFSFVVSLFATIALTVGGDLYAKSRSFSRKAWTKTQVTGVAALIAALALVFPRVPIASGSPGFPSDTAATLRVIPSGTTVLTYPYPYFPSTEAMSWQATMGMRFRILGGYVVTASGDGSGTLWTPLLTPPSIQEFFVASTYGPGQYYPAPSANADLGSDLCALMANYHVGAVVFWNTGQQPADVKTLLVSGLGAPTRTSADGTLDVWVKDPTQCSP